MDTRQTAHFRVIAGDEQERGFVLVDVGQGGVGGAHVNADFHVSFQPSCSWEGHVQSL